MIPFFSQFTYKCKLAVTPLEVLGSQCRNSPDILLDRTCTHYGSKAQYLYFILSIYLYKKSAASSSWVKVAQKVKLGIYSRAVYYKG